MSLRDGCAYRGCTYTAWHALHKVGRLRAGERVLVHSAAGAVGCMAMQFARDAGCQAVGLCGGPDKAAWLREFGCDEVVDYLRADWPQQALQLTAGRGFDVILDGNGGANAAHNIDLAARLGRIVYIGATAGADPAPAPVATLILKSIAVAGMSLRQVEEPPGSAADQEILAAILSGRWKLPISEVVPLAAVADLHRRLEARQLRGRAVIEVGGEF
jgi:NADPH2:quinone reductase